MRRVGGGMFCRATVLRLEVAQYAVPEMETHGNRHPGGSDGAITAGVIADKIRQNFLRAGP